VALAALSLAVATGIGIALMVESFRSDFERMLTVRLAGDLYVDAARTDADAVRGWLEAQPEVGAVYRFGRERVHLRGVPLELGYSRFDAAASARYGFGRPLADGEALISERLARDLDIGPGDEIDAAAGIVTIAATFPGFGDTVGRLLVDVSSLDRLGVEPSFDSLTVALTDQIAAARPLGERLTTRFPAVEVESRTELRQLALRIFDRTFAITRTLAVLALVVAVVGIYNALTGLRLQQAATTMLLSAEGVTPGQIRRMALIRAGTVGGAATILALPLGVAMAWTLCAVINPRSFGWTVELHFAVSAWLPPLVLGLLAAVFTGALPAPRERGVVHEGG
jgi:putative ABC transport system permease protein